MFNERKLGETDDIKKVFVINECIKFFTFAFVNKFHVFLSKINNVIKKWNVDIGLPDQPSGGSRKSRKQKTQRKQRKQRSHKTRSNRR